MILSETATGRIAAVLPAGLLDRIEQHLTEYGLPMTRRGDQLRLSYSAAELHLRLGPASLDLDIAAGTPANLHHARESAMYLLDHVFPEGAAGIVWTGGAPRSALPPNLHQVTVLSVRPVAAHFLRVEMACDDIPGLTTGGMHFSLLLPPDDAPAGRAPVWPWVGARGRTEWPEGADALHRSVYTFVTLDAAAGRFTFDIYEHDGGKTTEWARTVRPGAQVAVMGPGGGDFPPGDHLLIAGDETALPAIRRILEHSAPDRRGTVLIETGDPASRHALTMPAGMSLRWLTRGTDEPLIDALGAAPLPPAGTSRFVWVAGEQELARRAKSHFREARGLDRSEGYFSAYWAR